MTQNEKIIFEQNGISTDLKDEHNVVEFLIPENISGIVELNFKNLDNNNLATSTLPIVIDRVSVENEDIAIPEWIRNNALWWSQEQIDDNTFVQGIEYLIKNNIIVITQTQQETSESKEIPEWIRNNAQWWAAGQIDDKTFVQALEFLIKNGILHL